MSTYFVPVSSYLLIYLGFIRTQIFFTGLIRFAVIKVQGALPRLRHSNQVCIALLPTLSLAETHSLLRALFSPKLHLGIWPDLG